MNYQLLVAAQARVVMNTAVSWVGVLSLTSVRPAASSLCPCMLTRQVAITSTTCEHSFAKSSNAMDINPVFRSKRLG
ncbi:hypothetical protein EDC04DRAFT_2752312 [Pisolithus marmoratus]|nr:hypothetical protein EDC04DRAFT_2752312 [Pisolithus marmoratus]